MTRPRSRADSLLKRGELVSDHNLVHAHLYESQEIISIQHVSVDT